MKKIIFAIYFLLHFFIGNAQLNASFQKDTIEVVRNQQNDITLCLIAEITCSNSAGRSANQIDFAIDNTAATTMPTDGYKFSSCQIPVTNSLRQIECPITILHGKNTGGTAMYISIQMSYTNNLVHTKKIIIKVLDEKVKEKIQANDHDDNRIMFLNAYNFDFGGTTLRSNYVGHLNFFSPSLSSKEDSRWGWGFNTGIMKINYGQKDSITTSGSQQIESVLLSPFDTIKPGLKYLREINTYKTEKKNTVWSFYVQPTFELTKKNSQQHIYVHAHLELLATKWSATTTITNIKRDTSILPQDFTPTVFKSNLSTTNTYTIHSLSGYFGLGFIFDLKPWNGGSFFFQPTVGYTSNKPTLSSVDINSGLPVYYDKKDDKPRMWRSFYLIRANYKHILSKDATVIVGMDIRGLLPLYNPQYAAYIGLNIGLDSILGLIGGKKNE